MHLYALILKLRKETQPFKYMIAQFHSNMELTLVSEHSGLHKRRTKMLKNKREPTYFTLDVKCF